MSREESVPDRKKISYWSEFFTDMTEGAKEDKMKQGETGAMGITRQQPRTGLTDRRWPMELRLTEPEVELLREMLYADHKDLLREIARTDNRTMREGLKRREELLKGILDQIDRTVLKAS